MADKHTWPSWEDEDRYWRTNYTTRPYAATEHHDYDYYRPGYHFGTEHAHKFRGKTWDEVEADMKNAWNSWEYRASYTWEQMKDAARDAWERVTQSRSYVSA